MPRMHCIVHGTGTPKDRDEVNKRDTCEWDGWVCEIEAIGAPSIFRFIRIAAALARVLPIFDLSCERKAARLNVKIPPLVCCAGWTPEAAKKRSNLRWGIYTPRMHSIVRGTGTPKDRDEVNKRDACEWDGWLRLIVVYYESIKRELKIRGI